MKSPMLRFVSYFAVILISGCGKSQAERDFLLMVDRTKQEYKAEQIKIAVMPLFSKNANAKIAVPKEIAALPLFAQAGSEIDVGGVGMENGHVEGLAFTTGSGFGHWGIVICPSRDGEKIAHTLNGKIIPWEDGVYFFIER